MGADKVHRDCLTSSKMATIGWAHEFLCVTQRLTRRPCLVCLNQGVKLPPRWTLKTDGRREVVNLLCWIVGVIIVEKYLKCPTENEYARNVCNDNGLLCRLVEREPNGLTR